jgi:hypothetical protein
MTKVIIGLQSIDTKSGFDFATTADIRVVVKDHPENIDCHLRLLGLLATATLILSDDDEEFTVTVQEKE